jgi:hypothetical protein
VDTLAHGLWGAVGFYAGSKQRFASAFVLGMAPDLLSFGVFHLTHPAWILQRLSGELAAGPPPLAILPPFVFYAYNLTHSLVIWGAAFVLVGLLRQNLPLPFLAWGLHILCDILTHGLSYFPTPYLWPLPTPYVQGISWATPTFLIVNYASLVVTYLAVVAYSRFRSAERAQPERDSRVRGVL